MATIEDFKGWVNGLRYASWDGSVQVKEESESRLHVVIFTDVHSYGISVIPATSERPNGYLGCIASSRTPRAGEDWTRGNDLADGPLSLETWHDILADILGYEMVKVHRPRQLTADELASLPRTELTDTESSVIPAA